MKALIVNTGVFPIPPKRGGGTELHVYYLSNYLAKLGHEIHVVTDVEENSYFHPNINLIQIGSIPPSLNTGFLGWVLTHFVGGILTFKKAFRIMLHQNFDVVHVHSRLAGFLISLFNFFKGKTPRLIFTLHNPGPWLCTYDSYLEELLQKITFLTIDLTIGRSFDDIIVVGKPLSNELIYRWNIDRRKINVILNGVDVNLFNHNQYDIEKMKKYKIFGDYILTVGQLHKRKGIHFLIEAMRDIDEKCVVVGDGPERLNLKRLSVKQNLEPRIIFTGSVPREDLVSLYAGAKIFCLTSTAEGLPLVLLEAMSSGLPVVTFDVGCISDVVIDGLNGYLVKVRDVDELRSKINNLLSNETLLKSMGANSEIFIRKHSSWESIAEKVSRIYINDKRCEYVI